MMFVCLQAEPSERRHSMTVEWYGKLRAGSM